MLLLATKVWEQRKLLKVCKKEDNKRIPIKEQERKEGNTPYFGANGIQGYIDGYTHDGTNILIAEDGANNVKNYPIKLITGKIWVNNHAHVLNVNTKTNNGNFLVGAIKKINFYRYLVGSSRYKLTAESLSQVKIEITEQSEQEKIGELFKSIEELLTLYERKLKLLSQVKKYFLDNLFTEKEYPNLRFKGFTDAWEQRQLGEIGTTYSGLSGKNKSDFEKGNSNFVTFLEVLNNPILKNIDLTNKVEIKENEHQNKVKRNDILFNTSSETPEEVATSTVVDVNQSNLYLNSFCFGFRPNVKFSNYYIGYYLRSNHFRNRVFCLAQGISRYNISKKSLIKLKLSLPKLEEQDKIGKIFNQVELLLTLYENKKQNLIEIKKSLLNTMFI